MIKLKKKSLRGKIIEHCLNALSYQDMNTKLWRWEVGAGWIQPTQNTAKQWQLLGGTLRIASQKVIWDKGPRGKGWGKEPNQEDFTGTSPVAQWCRSHVAMQRPWVWSLVGELRSHMPRNHGAPVPQLEGPGAAWQGPTWRNKGPLCHS